MEIVNLILNIAVIVLIFLVGLFTKNYLLLDIREIAPFCKNFDRTVCP